MAAKSHDSTEMFRIIFDAMPSMIFVVDDDVRIEEYNTAAGELMTGNRETLLKRRGGDVLNCLHAKNTREGCGHAAFCDNCVIRNSVTEAFRGSRVVRRRTRIELIRGDERLHIYALITATPFLFEERPLVLLVIEDISEISELQRMITICSVCREVKDEKETWSRVESYFKNNWDVEFSHGLCPKCYQNELEKISKIETKL